MAGFEEILPALLATAPLCVEGTHLVGRLPLEPAVLGQESGYPLELKVQVFPLVLLEILTGDRLLIRPFHTLQESESVPSVIIDALKRLKSVFGLSLLLKFFSRPELLLHVGISDGCRY